MKSVKTNQSQFFNDIVQRTLKNKDCDNSIEKFVKYKIMISSCKDWFTLSFGKISRYSKAMVQLNYEGKSVMSVCFTKYLWLKMAALPECFVRLKYAVKVGPNCYVVLQHILSTLTAFIYIM